MKPRMPIYKHDTQHKRHLALFRYAERHHSECRYDASSVFIVMLRVIMLNVVIRVSLC